MLVPFESLHEASRIWIYQADRKFNTDEEALIADKLESFCAGWLAHGNPLKTSFGILYHQFVILGVDESVSGASGCSIDGSVRTLKALGQQLGIDFFDRTKVAFLEGDLVTTIPLQQLKDAFASGVINASSLTFNPMVLTKHAWEHQWILPSNQSWLIRYIPHSEIV